MSSTVEVTPEPPTIPATEPGILTPALEDEVEGETPADVCGVIFLTVGTLIFDWVIEASLWLKS